MTGLEHGKDAARVAAGLKAAIHNPNVSEEAKEHAMARLREMDQGAQPRRDSEEHLESSHVLGGYKATLSNPYTSEEAKRHAQEVLEAEDIYGRHAGATNEEYETRVIAGYKAALHNPRVSDAAKAHAHEYLKELGITEN